MKNTPAATTNANPSRKIHSRPNSVCVRTAVSVDGSNAPCGSPLRSAPSHPSHTVAEINAQAAASRITLLSLGETQPAA
jgi:hypothetical protein